MLQKFFLAFVFIGISSSTLFAQSEKSIVAVMEFDMAARRAYRALGTGLSDMLTNALVENGNFRVVERKRLVEIQQEQQIGLSGAIDPATSASIGRLVGAGYLVMGTITEFKENESGGVAGAFLRQSGVGIGMFQSHIGFTVRIVNATTGEIVTSKSVDKKVTKVGLAGGSLYGLPVGGIGYKSQAMEDAIEQALKETVEIIAQNLSVFDDRTPSAAFSEGYDAKSSCANFNPASGPKIMVVIPEVHLSGKVPDPAGETEIIKQLVELGFNVVDQQQVAMIREQEMVTNAINDPMAAASLGVEFGADVIIVGEAFSEFAGRNNNMISCRARVEARAIHTRTGRILATDGHHGSGMDISENLAGKTALKNAGIA